MKRCPSKVLFGFWSSPKTPKTRVLGVFGEGGGWAVLRIESYEF